MAVKLTPEAAQRKFNEGYYGDSIVGLWFCPNLFAHETPYPLKLRNQGAIKPFRCPECGAEMEYDEEE